jgi:hypothetical protein
MGKTLVTSDDADPSELLDQALALFTEVGDLAGQARVEVERGGAAQHRAGVRQQLAHLGQAYVLAMRSGDARLQAASAQ